MFEPFHAWIMTRVFLFLSRYEKNYAFIYLSRKILSNINISKNMNEKTTKQY